MSRASGPDPVAIPGPARSLTWSRILRNRVGGPDGHFEREGEMRYSLLGNIYVRIGVAPLSFLNGQECNSCPNSGIGRQV